MKVLLQDTQTKLFYAGPGRWAKDKTDALNFERIDRAAQIYDTENLPFAEILVEDDNPPLALPESAADRVVSAKAVNH